MGRPIKIAKGVGIDTGYENGLGLGVIGGDCEIEGAQIGCKMNVGGSVVDGFVIRQKGARKFYVSSEDRTLVGTCVLQNTATPSIGGMSISILTASADTKYLQKFNDTMGVTFNNEVYFLTMDQTGASATPPAGSTYEIAAIQICAEVTPP